MSSGAGRQLSMARRSIVGREARSDGTELIVVEAREPDSRGRGFEQETGHRQIAALLRSIGA